MAESAGNLICSCKLPVRSQVQGMSSKNAWYLITSEEIEQIRTGLQAVGTELRNNPGRVREMLIIIDQVQGRLA
jgi:hypothetical protein